MATVDDLDEALDILEREEVHLILSDVRLHRQQTGIHLARAAKARGVPTLFATGSSYPGASEIAVGCLTKPYTERQLCKAIESVDRHLQGEKVKTPTGLAFGLGGLAALLAFVVGIGLARPFMMRSMKLAEQMKTASPADRSSIIAEMQKLGARGAVVNRLVMALLLFALAAMAIARYV